MFRAQGFAAGVPYSIEVLDDGTIVGSGRIADLLSLHEAEQFSATPTHGLVALDLANPESILIALRTLTKISTTSGDVPDVDANDDPDEPEDAVH